MVAFGSALAARNEESTSNLQYDDSKEEPPEAAADGGETSTSHLLTDKQRLRMLGYDEVLDRPYNFWGLFWMNVFHESILYEFMLLSSLYAYNCPLLFIIGYPVQFLLHLCLLGTFSELASAFPVAGATATWAWRCARGGVRHERQWGWLVSGLVLASHLGRNLAALYNGAIGVTTIYRTMSQGLTASILPNTQKWNDPVFYLGMVTLAAIVVFARLGRNNLFWIIFGSMYTAYLIVAEVLILYAGYKANKGLKKGASMLVVAGLQKQAGWKYSDAMMIFTGIPLKMIAIDCPAHMAEETRNPARTVPRVMIASTIFHFVVVYTMVLSYTFCIVPVYGNMGSTTSPFLPLVYALNLNMKSMYALGIIGIVVGNMMSASSALVLTRFAFSLARDYAIPFGSTLLRINKGHEPWLADIATFAALYASVSSFWVNPANYYTLTLTFGYWFLAFPYTIVLILYVSSDLRPGQVDRSQFSLGKWSKPVACVGIVWGVLVLIQGSFPGHIWTIQTVKLKPNSISFLPFVLVGMVVLMLISWFAYGRRHYIGPIRALTKWSAGVELDPNDYTTSAGRGAAIRSYVIAQTRGSNSQLGKRNILSRMLGSFVRGEKQSNSSPESSRTRAGRLERITSSDNTNSSGVLPESDLMPDSATKRSRFPYLRGKGGKRQSESIGMSDVSSGSGGGSSNGRPLPESQIDPTRTYAIPESQLDPTRTNANTTGWGAALAESQIDPTRTHANTSGWGAAQEESQLDPTRTQAAWHPSSYAPGTRSYGQMSSEEQMQEDSGAETDTSQSVWVPLPFAYKPPHPNPQPHAPATRSFGVTSEIGIESGLEPLPESQLDPTRTGGW